MPKISQLTQVSPANTDIVQVLQGGENKKTTAKEVSGLQSIGYGQTWQDVTASRQLGVAYTNSTGKPILLSVCLSIVSACTLVVTVNGVQIYGGGNTTANNRVNGSFIIPADASYLVSSEAGAIDLVKWVELS